MVLMIVKTDLKEACGLSVILFETGKSSISESSILLVNIILYLKESKYTKSVFNHFIFILRSVYIHVSQEFFSSIT